LDVGSNTIRLLIAEPLPGKAFRPLQVEKKITRLGGDFSPACELNESSMERTVEALKIFADLLKKKGAETVFAVATGVVREARNGEDFLQKVLHHTGISLRLLSGDEEAHLMLQGVLWSLPEKVSPRIITDVGGWSTEILCVEREVPQKTLSVRLGTVALAEGFLKNDPPQRQELEAIEGSVRDLFRKIRGDWAKSGCPTQKLHPHLVGTAGTATTLAAIDLDLHQYDSQKVNGHLISRSRLEEMNLYLGSLPIAARRKIPGLEGGREDLILAGSAILLGIMEVFDLTSLEVIDSGLLEGILLEGIHQLRMADYGWGNGRGNGKI
jgi:exopolyphosphatase/guanosine-5'-triphosphate,3'-diphosphate pyrophosphatase